ncbi:hypothetical protein [Algoriphagus litoralis]|uniref:hypothetical protein n=1 Tax=Algoriphagus litoralis TaxID=2202829 RepID=UPI0018E51FAE|nr:hypothetical protein [Algoriphagus litoralis]
MLLIWASLLLPLFALSGSNTPPNARDNHILSLEADPQLVGPENLCIVFGNIVGMYSAGGDPGDVYDWEVTNSAGEVIFSRSGGIQLETIQVVFPTVGNYTVKLQVRRGTNSNFYQDQLAVLVQAGPELALLPDYLLCAGSAAVITALNPNTPNLSQYTIEWKDILGNIIGTGNELLAYTPGFYLVELFQTDASGNRSCVINGSTFVGPPIDFEIVPSSTSICEGESVSFELDTPLSGDWFLQKDFTGPRTLLESGFDFTVEPADLTGPGLYIVTFQTTTEDYPDCISEKIIAFEVKETPKVTATILNQPDACTNPNGTIAIRVDSDIDALYIPELNVIQNNLSAGSVQTFSNLKSQVYSIVVEKNGCQVTQLLILPSDPSIGQVNPTLSIQDETCSTDGVSSGIVEVDFGAPVPNGSYRVLAIGRGETDSGIIPTSGQLNFPISAGTYLLELTADGCTYPVETITIAKATQVEYTVPSSLNICETFELKPETSQNLTFSLNFPNGNTETISAGQSYTLTESGTYTIIGSDPTGILCPKKIAFDATLSSSIAFAPILAIEKCFDPIRYKIDLQGVAEEDASIRWFNETGEIVGRGPDFYPPGLGNYSLLVQPLQSGFCPVSPVDFVVVAPITSVPMDLEANKICPEPNFAIITLSTTEEEVDRTEWIYFDENDQRTELDQFEGLFEIQVENPGTYEVVAYNQLGCEIGRNLIAVENSILLTQPMVEESYGVCSKGKKGPIIDPGDFDAYEWFLGEQLVSTDPQFSPKEVGEYTLKVTTADGCEFFASFRTYDACSFEYVFPNAMILDDGSRTFEVRVSEGITSVDLFIINRKGGLVHSDRTEEISYGEPILQWDGKVSGANIPSGTYVVVLVGKNPLYQFEEKIIGSLLVLD